LIQHLQGESVRRLVVTSTVLALSTVGLAACGSGDKDSHLTGKVTVTGDFGAQPTVKYSGKVSTDTTIIKVLHKGTGAKVEDGDSVTANMYIGNGFTGDKALSTFDEGQSPSPVDVSKSTLPAIEKALKGQTVGSRIEVIAAPKDTWGTQGGNAQLNVGNKDTTVWVIDVISKVGVTDVAADKVPALKEAGGTPSGFDFSKSPKVAPTELQRATLKEGTGAAITSGQKVKVRYLGSVWGSEKVFDESFSKGKQPFEVTVGQGGVIKGWDLGLKGAKVGSRIELVIPADLGYGASGQGQTIPPNSTLVFVIDVLSAS
jgi:peptidylprolyl isomerase